MDIIVSVTWLSNNYFPLLVLYMFKTKIYTSKLAILPLVKTGSPLEGHVGSTWTNSNLEALLNKTFRITYSFSYR